MRGIDTFLAIKEQASLHTPADISTLSVETGDYLAFNTESLSGSQQIISNPAIRKEAMRSRAYSAMGTMEAGGAVEFTASNWVLDKLLPFIFHQKDGLAEAADGSGATYTLVAGGELTPFTTFVGFDGDEGAYTRIFTGAKVNTATFSARVNDMLRLNLNVAAVEKTLDSDTVVTPEYPGGDDEYAFVYDQAKVQLMSGDMAALVEVPVEAFDLNVNHNLNTNAYRLGSAKRRSLTEGVTEVDGTFTIDLATTGLDGVFALDGSATNDPAFFERVASEARFAELVFTVVDPTRVVVAATDPDGVANSGDETEAVYSTLEIRLPFVRLEEPGFNVSDAGLISGSARFVAYDDVTVKHVASFGTDADGTGTPSDVAA